MTAVLDRVELSQLPVGEAPALAPPRERLRVGEQLSAGRRVARSFLLMVLAAALFVALYATVLSSVLHATGEVRAYAHFRNSLARGTIPVSPLDGHGHPLALGTPVALFEIPRLHVRQVVLEGTTAGVLMNGLGHRRDTSLPGQTRTAVIYGRRAAFGGSFSHLGRLRKGDLIKTTTGQGPATYRVLGRRRGGDPAPLPPAAGAGRLQLVTATGPAFVPSGVLRVDAELVGDAAVTPAQSFRGVPRSEMPLATDLGQVWALVLWLEALLVAAVLAVWAWMKWGQAQSWIGLSPVIILLALGAASAATRLLPNLL